MYKTILITLLAFSSITVVAAQAADSVAWEMTESASPQLAKIVGDIGVKCGVNARTASQAWITQSYSTNINKPFIQAASTAISKGQDDRYRKEISQITCPKVD
jgi:hypothetical protein